MLPVLFSSGALTITSYSALIDLGLIVASAIALRQAHQTGRSLAATVDVLLAAIVAGVIGARLGYVAMHWPYFVDHLDEAWQAWRGGLSWHGGLVGGTIGAALLVRLRLRQSILGWLDMPASGAALGVAFGWIGCWLSACAYGKELFPGEPFFAIAVDAPDAFSVWAPRWPSQLLGAAWGVVVFAALRRLPDTKRAGVKFSTFVALYAIGSLLIGFTRADADIVLGGWSVEQWLDAALVVAGAIGTLIASVRKQAVLGVTQSSHRL